MATKYSKRHYQHLAQFLRDQEPDNEILWELHNYWVGLVHALAEELALDNPRFDCSRFLTACGAPSAPAPSPSPGKTLAEVFAESERSASGLPRLTVSDLPALKRLLQE